MKSIRQQLEMAAVGCREGLMSLTHSQGSTFYGFPAGACGVASDIVGRVVWETLRYQGDYVCGRKHPNLATEATHAWFEIGDFIIDITHDQFDAAGLSGWVFKRNEGWHAWFAQHERRQGYCSPAGWPAYPFDGYDAAIAGTQNIGLIKTLD